MIVHKYSWRDNNWYSVEHRGESGYILMINGLPVREASEAEITFYENLLDLEGELVDLSDLYIRG